MAYPLRICLVHNAYGDFSGEEAVVDRLMRMLKDRGHEVFGFFRSSAEIPRMRAGRIRAFFSGVYSPSSARRMRRILEDRRPDVVHVHNVFPLISPSILGECRRAGVPVVMTVHNYRLTCPGGLHVNNDRICEKCLGGREYWCVLRNCQNNLFKSVGYALRNHVARTRRSFLDNVTIYLALTRFQRRRLIDAGFAPGRIAVLPNTSERAANTAESPAGRYVGFVGRVSPEKGAHVLVAAAGKCPDVAFKAAGAYDRMPGLVRKAPGNFDFLGQLDRRGVERFYRNCRFVVLPSVCFEGFPAVLVEAMLHSRPVICSRIGAMPEIVQDGMTGLLFEPGNAEDLAEKIRYLWDRPGLCRRMGRLAAARAASRYSPNAYYRKLIGVYETALALGPGSRAARPELARAG